MINVAGIITLSSAFAINTSVMIHGPGASHFALDGSHSTQTLVVTQGETVSVAGRALQNSTTSATTTSPSPVRSITGNAGVSR